MLDWLFGKRKPGSQGGPYCTQCGAANSKDARFCKQCGVKLQDAASAPAQGNPASPPQPTPAPPQSAQTPQQTAPAPSGDFATRARAAILKEVPNEQELAENSSYQRTKLAELQELGNLAIQACQMSGHEDAVAHVTRIQSATFMMMAGWGPVREQVQRNPQLTLWLATFPMMLMSSWTTLVGVVQLFGLSDPSGAYSDEAQLLSNLDSVASSSEQLKQKMVG